MTCVRAHARTLMESWGTTVHVQAKLVYTCPTAVCYGAQHKQKWAWTKPWSNCAPPRDCPDLRVKAPHLRAAALTCASKPCTSAQLPVPVR